MFQQQQPTPTWQQFSITARRELRRERDSARAYKQPPSRRHMAPSHSRSWWKVGAGWEGSSGVVGLKRKRNRN